MRKCTLVFCWLENTLDPDLSRSTYADASHGSYRIRKRYPDLGTLEDPWFRPFGALPLRAAAPPLEARLHARAGQRGTATRLAAQAVPTQPARACPAAARPRLRGDGGAARAARGRRGATAHALEPHVDRPPSAASSCPGCTMVPSACGGRFVTDVDHTLTHNY